MVAFDDAADRPEHIDTILNGLDRYNPETTATFQEYVAQQCENQTYDAYANLALLKLYQFNPHLSNDNTVIAILSKTLTVFPSPDFSLALHLLPPSVLILNPAAQKGPGNTLAQLAEDVQKLNNLNNLLSSADYTAFWSTLHSDSSYGELTQDVAGFEDLIRVRIAATVSQSIREIDRRVLESWLDIKGENFDDFVKEECGWSVETSKVTVPINRENEARGTVVRENVKFDQFARIVRRAYEQQA